MRIGVRPRPEFKTVPDDQGERRDGSIPGPHGPRHCSTTWTIASPPLDYELMPRAFPGVISEGETIRRYAGVAVDPELRGLGLGQLALLDGLACFPGSWFWGTSVTAQGGFAWRALEKRGLIHLFWNGRHQVVLVRINPAGLAALGRDHPPSPLPARVSDRVRHQGLRSPHSPSIATRTF